MPPQTAQPPKPRRLRVFLCHSSGDKPAVRDLYRRLCADGIQPWLPAFVNSEPTTDQ